jgi:hypothetical protein
MMPQLMAAQGAARFRLERNEVGPPQGLKARIFIGSGRHG